ncbi:MAG TPA: low molecular weight protein-tyrosine-phosphatase [Enhygromyxa sp.]|nr:low molecular weight protein-tyrosine-phosphatase [Enhygromyxa sp.]
MIMPATIKPSVSICFVCLGNICRSPTAEGVFTKLVRDAGLSGKIAIDSAGTGAWHKGELADKRARQEAQRRGIELHSVARQITAKDFELHDLLIAMDRNNVADLQALARGTIERGKIKLFRSFDPLSPGGAEIPDPYYGGPEGFSEVFDLCTAAGRGLLAHVRKTYRL